MTDGHTVAPPRPGEAQSRLRAFAAACPCDPWYAVLAAHSDPVHLVGGSVRDVLLGQPLHDLDFTTARGAFDLARRVADACGGRFVALKRERGMARVVFPSSQIDLADHQGPSLEADLASRDLTLNALALDAGALSRGEAVLVDPVDGLTDLCAGRLRCPSPRVLDDDPLRLLRVVRFACTLGFAVDPSTLAALGPRASTLSRVAAERVRDELFRILDSPRTREGVALLERCALLGVVLPERTKAASDGSTMCAGLHERETSASAISTALRRFETLDAVAIPSARAGLDDPTPLDAWLEARLSGEHRSARALLRFVVLLHPEGRGDGEAAATSYGDLTSEACIRLHLSTAERALLVSAACHHLNPRDMAATADLRPRDIRRWFARVGGAGIAAVLLSLTDEAACGTTEGLARVQAVAERLLRWYFGGGPDRCVPLLDGRTIGGLLGEPPGPRIGEWLARLADEQADGAVTSPQEAEAWIRRAASQESGQTPS